MHGDDLDFAEIDRIHGSQMLITNDSESNLNDEDFVLNGDQ